MFNPVPATFVHHSSPSVHHSVGIVVHRKCLKIKAVLHSTNTTSIWALTETF
jgi:hypothetical protein